MGLRIAVRRWLKRPAFAATAIVTLALLPLLGVAPLLGRGFSTDDDRSDTRVVILPA